MLPAGPAWKCVPIETLHPTKNKTRLYCRNPVECLEALFRSPLIADNMDLGPFELYESAQKLMRIYTEWLSGNVAKTMQVRTSIHQSKPLPKFTFYRMHYLLAQRS